MHTMMWTLMFLFLDIMMQHEGAVEFFRLDIQHHDGQSSPHLLITLSHLTIHIAKSLSHSSQHYFPPAGVTFNYTVRGK